MSLRSKFLLRNWGLLFGLLLVAGASLWGLEGLRRAVHVTLGAYDDLATMQSAAQNVYSARGALESTHPDAQRAASLVHSAAAKVSLFIDHEQPNYDMGYARTALSRLQQAEVAITHSPAPQAIAALDEVQGDMNYASATCRQFIEAKDKSAGRRVVYTMMILSGIFAVILAGGLVSSILQYRQVMLPLERLRQGVRRVTTAQFSESLVEEGGSEFRELAREFNHMAAELESFYRRLEEKVAATSQELVRSERLASVGFLAAGVAHEINNPLNIISGYAELSMKRLTSNSDKAAVDDTLGILRVIRSESFRCKEITGKLLSLAKGGGGGRESVALDSVARDVAMLARGLQDYRDRQIELKFDGALDVVANATEMKQVLLNLTVNALQAVSPVEGKVWIEGHRRSGWIELSVRDNGHGIPADSLKHVFEPFYTRRPGARPPGTGLGLSITHAIVENHGGRIRAESSGIGLGSRFTLELPAVAGKVK